MPDSEETVRKMASEIFDLYRAVALVRAKQPTGDTPISETEYLVLDVVSKEQPITIGDVQKRIGVLPAQMSRIVRAMETQGGRGLVACAINAEDRRRIDLTLTDEGAEALDAYRTARMRSMHHILQILPPDDRLNLMRIVHTLTEAINTQLGH